MDIIGMFDEDILDLIVPACEKKKRKRKPRSCWVRPYYMDRNESGAYVSQFLLLKQKDPILFHQYTRMGVSDFEELLNMVAPVITKQCVLREPISAEIRLIITLRYLATGESQRSLGLSYKCSPSALSKIVSETTAAISDVLKTDVFPHISKNYFERTAAEFNEKWQFPHCIAAIDGKHVQIEIFLIIMHLHGMVNKKLLNFNLKAPPKAGSMFFNYKKTHSIVLMAACDAQYKFIMCEVGAAGRESDNGVFSRSKFGKLYYSRKLPIPEPCDISPNAKNMPYVIVADDAFPLENTMMKPFAHRMLTCEERVFNYRLSRARRIIENAFGILVVKWRIFKCPIKANLEHVEQIVMATTCLHNWLRYRKNSEYVTPGIVDREVNGEYVPGEWREIQNNMHNISTTTQTNASISAKGIRNKFKEYFITDGAVPWQFIANQNKV